MSENVPESWKMVAPVTMITQAGPAHQGQSTNIGNYFGKLITHNFKVSAAVGMAPNCTQY
jgi:hypothetical protein